MENNLYNKLDLFILGKGVFYKLISQFIIIVLVILISNSNALALNFTYDGTHNLEHGWNISTTVPGFATSGSLLHADNGVADGNNLTITNGNGIDGAIGGWTDSNINVENNSVTLSGGFLFGGVTESTPGSFYGGYSTGSGNVTSNRVTISNNVVFNKTVHIYGGYMTGSGIVENNIINITSATFSGFLNLIYAGYSSNTGNVLNNKTIIEGIVNFADSDTDLTSIYGGYSTSSGNVSGNSVTIGDGVNFNNETSIYGGRSDFGLAINNSVSITGGKFTRLTSIYGGVSLSRDATHNSVSITGGEFSGTTSIYGGRVTSGFVTNNSVDISGGTFDGTTFIYGGYSAHSGALNNSITINGGTFTPNTTIVGGQSDVVSGTLPALHNNTVTLDGSTLTGLDLSGATITGGQHGTNSNSAAIRRTGNRLIVKNKVKVGDVRNFEYFDFYLNKATDDAPLTSNGAVNIGSDAIININIVESNQKLQIGDFIKLIDVSNGSFTGSSSSSYAIDSVSFMYALTEHLDTVNKIYGMAVNSVEVNPLSTGFVESRLASFSFMNQANNLILGQGINSAMESIMTDPSHWALFTVLSGTMYKYDTSLTGLTGDSWVAGSSFILGIAKALPIPTGDMFTGIYFETGVGSIRSSIHKNQYVSGGSISTDGNTQYYGGGALLRYSMDNGFYTEGFLRIGALTDELQSQHIDTFFNHGSTSMYVGAGVNLGYELKLFRARDMLDIYTNYTWGHLNGYSHLIDDYNYEFNSINSHQVAVGVQYNFIQQRMFSPFVGVSAEYELDTEATATIEHSYQTLSPNLKGLTGVAEVGVRIVPNRKIPLTMALNFGGHFGRRNGLDTSFDLEWRFGGKSKEEVDRDNINKAEKLQKTINSSNIYVEAIEDGVSINIGELLFKIDSYKLTAKGKKELKRVMKEIQNNYPNRKIIVIGHTDSIGSFEHNQRLSENRAKTVVDILKDGIDEENISYDGQAFTDPIAPNNTKKGRAKNRRVEIIIQLDDDTELKR